MELVLRENHKSIPTKMVYKIKEEQDSSVQYKARIDDF